MTICLLVSPAASGKTHQCLDRVQQVKTAHPMAPLWVIVPDRLQAKASRRRLAEGGGAFAVHVGTFGDLYTMVPGRSSGYAREASESSPGNQRSGLDSTLDLADHPLESVGRKE